jgi:beta-1,2-mannobiose phosphorylase / 1,2-beta-oligomannan phosphorylase
MVGTNLKPEAVGQIGSKIFLISRESGVEGARLVFSKSADGKKFPKKVERISIKDLRKTEENIAKCREFKLSSAGKEIFLTYLRSSGRASTLVVAVGSSLKNLKIISSVKTGGPGVYVRSSAKSGVVYFGRDVLRVSSTKDLKRWSLSEGQKAARWRFFDGLPFEIAGAHSSKLGNFVFCGSVVEEEVLNDVNRGWRIGEVHMARLGVALFRHDRPTELLWQTDLPFMDTTVQDMAGFKLLGVTLTGSASRRKIRIYMSIGGEVRCFEFPESALKDRHAYTPILFTKAPHNPIMSPGSGAIWEDQSIMNPAALKVDDKVHILYRAIGSDGISRLGYAISHDGLNIAERFATPALALTDPRSSDVEHKFFDPVMYPSGGSWGGAEDPRTVLIDDTVYLTFNMFDGWDNLRVAVVWIKLEDFLGKKFWKWSKPIYLSPPRQVHKNWVLFPEKINGKFALFHNLHGSHNNKVEIEYFDDFSKFDLPKNFKSANPNAIADRPMAWHKRMRSAGPPPLKTRAGWLLFYHATDRYEPSRYKLGAVLLDLKDPTKILYRAKASLLNPDEWYENAGKPGIVYACGAVEMGGMIYIYYGGADRVACVAGIKTEELLKHIIKSSDQNFKISTIKIS